MTQLNYLASRFPGSLSLHSTITSHIVRTLFDWKIILLGLAVVTSRYLYILIGGAGSSEFAFLSVIRALT
jgi:hypothetical protein